MHSPEGGERELLVRAATRMFAALGYDGTSMEQVAEAAQMDLADIHPHFATKRELYLEVMRHVRDVLSEALQAVAEEMMTASPERQAEMLYRFIDAYIDMCVAHPEVPALWMHRWLSDASDISDLELESAQPLAQLVVDAVAKVAGPADADALHTTYTMIWCIQGFALSGVLNGSGRRKGVEDAEQLERFRKHMHQLIGRVLRLS
ncbi:TetR/AcrR family transcriptional regulator [Nonomuraea insulae]|uniref:TetR/AcrR family transcriptional regulator n=1 Tax=Nonomuraea insulae TaxID=1616787 RepID=A0ABW1D3R4_9ACTN